MKEDDPKSFKQLPPGVMGPRFRGDDSAFCGDGSARFREQDVSPCGPNMRAPLRAGIVAAIVTLALDQASKLWLLYGLDIGHRGTVRITPFFDLVLAWNIGISFGWFQNDNAAAQIALMIVKALAVIALAIWMARSQTLMATVALGLIIGGAIGNGIDRLAYGAVVDFALFHVQIGGNTFNWYVFNLADVAIVAGVMALLYDSFIGVPAAKAP